MSELAPEGAPVEPVEAPREQDSRGCRARTSGRQRRSGSRSSSRPSQPQQPQYQQQGPPIPDPFSETYAAGLPGVHAGADGAATQQFHAAAADAAQGEQQAMEMLGEIAASRRRVRQARWRGVAREPAATRGAPTQRPRAQQLLAQAAKAGPRVREAGRRGLPPAADRADPDGRRRPARAAGAGQRAPRRSRRAGTGTCPARSSGASSAAARPPLSTQDKATGLMPAVDRER